MVDPSGPISRKVLRMESKGDLGMNMHASPGIRRGLSAASVLENQGSADFSSYDGSLPSFSSTSSKRYSTDLIDGATNGEVSAMLQDAEVRAVLRKVTINEGVWNMTIQRLGGGEKGLKILIGYIMVWVKKQRDIKSSSPQPPPPPPSNPAWNLSTMQDVFLQPSSGAFQMHSGILQPPPTTELLDHEMRYTQRFKSRKLMTGEREMGAGFGGSDIGFCPSSFISIPEDYKLEATSSDIMAPYISQQHQPVIPFTSAHNVMRSIETTPTMATKAARRRQMSRQRQSFHARAASPASASSPVSVGGGSLRKTNAAASPPVASSGMSEVQITPTSAPVAAAWEGRSMECLTVLLQKVLRPSDVGHLGRIVLPKIQAEQCMPSLTSRVTVSIQMEDFDSGHAWNLRYSVIAPPKLGSSPRVTSGTSSFWPNNKSRMYILENTEAFVISHNLVEGDLLVIYRILQGGYVLRGMKKKNGRPDIEPVQVDFGYSSARRSLEGQPSLPENRTHDQRLYGCCPSDKSAKEEPVNLDDDPFLTEVILSMDPSSESDSSCIPTLGSFPSLTLGSLF